MELYRFARDNGIADIVEAMPADVMRQILRNKGITSIAVPDRQLGAIEVDLEVTEQRLQGRRKRWSR